MFSELKNAYKIVQYGLSLKKQLAFAVGFALIGIVLEIVTQGRQATGAFYIVLSGLFIYQLIISADEYYRRYGTQANQDGWVRTFLHEQQKTIYIKN